VREAPRLSGYDQTPIYTMKTVVQQTGITPTTLRAWERRYGILQPDRSDGGYRLYSDQDIAMLRWLKGQVEAGVSIGRAVALLEVKRHEPQAEPVNGNAVLGMHRFRPSSEPDVSAPRIETRHVATISEELVDVLLKFCETKASTILSEAFALYPLDTVTEDIIVPALTEVGDRWHQGAVSVVQANFATGFLRQRVTSLFTAYSQPASGPLAVAGSGPGEWHDIGILLVSLALRRRGWRVLYLGQNVPVSQLTGVLPDPQPELICFSATTVESVDLLLAALKTIARRPATGPRLLLGGRAFNLHPELRGYIPDSYLGATASDAVAALVSPA
jgi:MerR family transcriptional regulator, light-induced transcriptional regulator